MYVCFCVQESKQCPQCKQPVKRRHLKRMFFASGDDYDLSRYPSDSDASDAWKRLPSCDV